MKSRLTLFLLLAFGALAALAADKPAKSDEELVALLIGSWTPDPKSQPTLDAVTTYRADGTATETAWNRGQPSTTGVVLKVRWSLKNRILSYKIVESNDPEGNPVGYEMKQRIIALTDERFDYEFYEGYGAGNGTRGTDLRKPEG